MLLKLAKQRHLFHPFRIVFVFCHSSVYILNKWNPFGVAMMNVCVRCSFSRRHRLAIRTMSSCRAVYWVKNFQQIICSVLLNRKLDGIKSLLRSISSPYAFTRIQAHFWQCWRRPRPRRRRRWKRAQVISRHETGHFFFVSFGNDDTMIFELVMIWDIFCVVVRLFVCCQVQWNTLLNVEYTLYFFGSFFHSLPLSFSVQVFIYFAMSGHIHSANIQFSQFDRLFGLVASIRYNFCPFSFSVRPNHFSF